MSVKRKVPIRKPGSRKPRYLVYGRHKQGKTTFLESAGKILILDPESGAEQLNPDKVDLWPINTWTDINEAYQFLSKGSHPYEWVGVDGLTRINNMALRYVMKMAEERDLDRRPGMVDRRDYNKSGELMKGMIFNFHNLHDVGLIFTAQDRMDGAFVADVEEDDEDMEDVSARYVPDLPKGVRSSVSAVVDVIGRIYSQKVTGIHPKTKEEVTIRQRRLWISPSDSYDTGYRSEHRLPDYLKNPTVPKLGKLIKEGSV